MTHEHSRFLTVPIVNGWVIAILRIGEVRLPHRYNTFLLFKTALQFAKQPVTYKPFHEQSLLHDLPLICEVLCCCVFRVLVKLAVHWYKQHVATRVSSVPITRWTSKAACLQTVSYKT